MNRSRSNRDSVTKTAFLVLFGGLYGIILAMWLSRNRKSGFEEDGATTIRVPLLVAKSHQLKVRKMSQRRLFQLLQTLS